MDQKSFVFRFGEYEVSERNLRVGRAGETLALEPKALKVLLYLLHNPGRLVGKDELLNAVWGDTAVTENSLTRAVALLRKVLDDDIREPRFIATVPTAGYRFICPVEAIDELPAKAGTQPQSSAADGVGVTGPPPIFATKLNVPAARPAHLWRWVAVAAALTLLLVAVAGGLWYLRRPLPPPRFTDYVLLTNDGRQKAVRGTDGSNLFLNLSAPGGIAVVPISGGQLTPIPIDLPTRKDFPNEDPILETVAPDGSSLLVRGHFEALKGYDFWVVGALGHPARYLVKAVRAAWSPDGRTVLYSTLHGDLYTIPVEGGEFRLLLASPAPANQFLFTSNLVWSPDGTRIRFVRNGRYWEVSATGTGLHEVFPGWNPSIPMCCGHWTPDGEFFLFIAGAGLSNTSVSLGAPIWVEDERRKRMRPTIPEPVQMTTGPTRWIDIVMSSDGKRVFSRGVTSRGELVIQETKSNQLLPYLGGISAEHVSFSRDGKYLVYVTFPEGVMWRANRDGSGLMQLTRPPVHPKNPRWSPDGTRILFNDSSPGQVEAMFTVSSQGGTPERVLPDDGENEGDPTWSPDGKEIVFGHGRSNGPTTGTEGTAGTAEMICILDLTTGKLKTLPPSPKFVWSPRWSPDGRYIVGLTVPIDDLGLFDMRTGKWSLLNPQQGRIDYPSWSHDGRFIYFFVGSAYQDESIGEPGVYRMPVTGGKAEKVVDLRGFRHTGWYSLWMGLDPDDRPMLLRDEGTDEIYALTLERK